MTRPSIGNCYVCGEPVHPVPIREQLGARRALNVPVVLLTPGVDPRHPDGLCRHSYCAPGTDRWAHHLGTRGRDAWWARIFGFARHRGHWTRKGDTP